MEQERQDYADPPGGPSVLVGLAWLAGLFLVLAVMVFALALFCAFAFQS